MAAYSVTVTWPNRVHGGYLRSSRCAFSTTSLSTVPRRARTHHYAPGFNFNHAEQQVCKHAEVFSRGFLDFKGGQRQRKREQPTFISLRRALASPPARAGRRLPLQESRTAVLLPAVHDRAPAPPVPTDTAAPKGIFSSLHLTVLPLSSVETTLFI